jgi:NAD-dependent SIR2 family protein deacetylase
VPGEVALLLGAGVSVPAGLDSWHGLLAKLADEAGLAPLDVTPGHLTATDHAELIEKSMPERFKERVAAIVKTATRPSLLHALLAGLDCREVVTTNYDTPHANQNGGQRCTTSQRRSCRSAAVSGTYAQVSDTCESDVVIELESEAASQRIANRANGYEGV